MKKRNDIKVEKDFKKLKKIINIMTEMYKSDIEIILEHSFVLRTEIEVFGKKHLELIPKYITEYRGRQFYDAERINRIFDNINYFLDNILKIEEEFNKKKLELSKVKK